MEWVIGLAVVSILIWFVRGPLGDWLYARRRAQEAWDFFQEETRIIEALPDKEGRRSESGNWVCPHCGHELSLSETLQSERFDGLPHVLCPHCQQTFK